MKKISKRKRKSDVKTALSSPLIVNREDICKIGHTANNNDGYFTVVCFFDTCDLKELFLRTILRCFGPEYKITDKYDCLCDCEKIDDIIYIVYETNLSWEVYCKMTKLNINAK